MADRYQRQARSRGRAPYTPREEIPRSETAALWLLCLLGTVVLTLVAFGLLR